MFDACRLICFSCDRLHINARGYDLDNEFFIDLGTPCKWVTSTVSVFGNFVVELDYVHL